MKYGPYWQSVEQWHIGTKNIKGDGRAGSKYTWLVDLAWVFIDIKEAQAIQGQ